MTRHGLDPEFSISDFEYVEHQHLSIVVATPRLPVQHVFSRHEIVILEPPESSHTIDALAAELSMSLESYKVTPKRMRWGQDLEGFGDMDCICLLELAEPLLEDIGLEDFARLQRLVSSTAKLLWVASLDTPAGALAVGMARSIRNEVASKEFRTLSVQGTSIKTPKTLAQLLTKLAVTPTKDSEYLEEDGLLKTCRVVEDALLDEQTSQTLIEEKDRIESIPLGCVIGAQKLAVLNQGLLESICLAADDLASTELADDEVEIEVKATSLK